MGRRLRKLKALILRRRGRVETPEQVKKYIAEQQLVQGMMRRTKAPIRKEEKK